MTQTLREIQTYRMEFLSPVHVGTEEQLGPQDVLYHNGQLRRVRPEPLLVALQSSPQLMDRYVTDGLAGIANWLQPGLLDRITLYATPAARGPQWQREPVRPFLADPLLRPYVPGTEIKGTIRTALLWSLIRAHPSLADLAGRVGRRQDRGGPPQEVRDRRFVGQWLVQSVLGQDPNHDLLRSLRVQDTRALPPRRLRLLPVVVAGRGQGGLRLFRRPGEYTDDIRQAVANFCECLTPEAGSVEVTVELDRFLLRGQVKRGSDSSVPGLLDWEDSALALVDRWPEACNGFARHVAGSELRWWQEASKVAPQRVSALAGALVRFYGDLLRRMEEPDRSVYLILGWGGGWRTKTVTEAFGEDLVQRVVRRYKLDRGAGSRPFPKTRKVAWLGGQTFAPLGWVRLVPV